MALKKWQDRLLMSSVALLACGFFIVGIFQVTKKSPSASSSSPLLNASVEFTGTQMVITNSDAFNWENVEIEINRGYFLKTPLIQSKTTYTVGAAQFAKGDGTRFNPFTMKPQKVSILCDTHTGKRVWIGNFK